MELTATFFLMAVPAVLIAGVSKGGFGSGGAFLATPLMATVVEPVLAVSLMLPLLMVMDVTSIRAFWRKWDWDIARGMMIGAVFGVAAATALFGYADADTIRLLIGSIAIGFVLFQLARQQGLLPTAPAARSPRRAGFWGGCAGFTSFISHAGGPPASMHLLSQGLSKTSFQATTVLLFWWINLIKVPPYAALGMFTRETLTANVILMPVAILGALIGIWAHDRVPERLFFGLTYLLLALAGTKLIFDALT